LNVAVIKSPAVKHYLQLALDWSEIWAMIIPLSVLLFRRQQPVSLRPVVIYLWLGFLINVGIDIIMAINVYLDRAALSNNPLYNIHSVVRFGCFSFYFIHLQKNSFSRLKRFLGLLGITFLVVNFIFFENFFNPNSFSGNLLTVEAYLLLVYCVLYYLAELKDDENPFNGPHFWVVTGLAIYLVTNFFVFLFYMPMLNVNVHLAVNIWDIHNIAFIIFCFFIAKAFYGTVRYQYSV
jgi:hypothetical protein